MLVAWGVTSSQSARYRTLALRPDDPVTLDEASTLLKAELGLTTGGLGQRDEAG
jgi:hypothetical protein